MTTTSAIIKPKATLYLPLGTGVNFSHGPGGPACWSPLAYDAAAGTRTYNGYAL